MPTYIMTKSQGGQLQHVYTLSMLLLLIGTPKRQATVETATFGSEFVAARIATDQITDLRYSLMYLGVPVIYQKAKCLVTTNLWLTVPIFPLLPCPRNQLWLHIIESEKPLLQDIFNSTGKMENPTLQTS